MHLRRSAQTAWVGTAGLGRQRQRKTFCEKLCRQRNYSKMHGLISSQEDRLCGLRLFGLDNFFDAPRHSVPSPSIARHRFDILYVTDTMPHVCGCVRRKWGQHEEKILFWLEKVLSESSGWKLSRRLSDAHRTRCSFHFRGNWHSTRASGFVTHSLCSMFAPVNFYRRRKKKNKKTHSHPRFNCVETWWHSRTERFKIICSFFSCSLEPQRNMFVCLWCVFHPNRWQKEDLSRHMIRGKGLKITSLMMMLYARTELRNRNHF